MLWLILVLLALLWACQATTTSPTPRNNDSACLLANSTLSSLHSTLPSPAAPADFTSYMDRHDPFTHGCTTPFPPTLNSALIASAYAHQASWYNAAQRTLGPLIAQCEEDTAFFHSDLKTYKTIGLRHGLPATWEEVEEQFAACPEIPASDAAAAEGSGKKGGEDDEEDELFAPLAEEVENTATGPSTKLPLFVFMVASVLFMGLV
ncbi:hypothetical protein BU26DRAFT_562628 [Trematosphaeria pertusa]|uniref:Uncharacterized protein n=1 Tax=Trematosphaeria pertusa TaxID=390896 RepID=A0A6A6IKC6_9PLEO|nr:uncharacterized protein BU26DRAFT_562628 [Trematosphaeria pertusa]KAF2250659.1 hypothetical protein BU26DRAFT_562628 [Trematosphaeria pertusa]